MNFVRNVSVFMHETRGRSSTFDDVLMNDAASARLTTFVTA
jgi:hypothetical protein